MEQNNWQPMSRLFRRLWTHYLSRQGLKICLTVFSCILLLDYCGFLAHQKPKKVSPSKVKNIVNFSYLNFIRVWDKRMRNVQKQYVNFSLSTIKLEGKRRIRWSLRKRVKGSVLIDNSLYAKYNGKNSIYILSTINYNFTSTSKTIRNKNKSL